MLFTSGVLSLVLWRFRSYFRSYLGTTLDISRLTPRFFKNGKSVADYQYKATTLYGKLGRRNGSCFHFDASYRIILHCGKYNVFTPIACISFYNVGRGVIRIMQIQGPSYDKEENKETRLAAFKEIKWERLLVQVVCEWAKVNRFRCVQLISCTKSWWYQGKRHQQMFMRYDVTARRMGFALLGKEGVYERDMSNLKLLGQATA